MNNENLSNQDFIQACRKLRIDSGGWWEFSGTVNGHYRAVKAYRTWVQRTIGPMGTPWESSAMDISVKDHVAFLTDVAERFYINAN